MVNNYQRLSQVYDSGWGDFAEQYVKLIEEMLAERGITEGRILELACGTGNLARELARRGHYVHGIDLSAEMIALARRKAEALPNLTFDVQDMAHLRVDTTFEMAICTFDSINYLVNPVDVGACFHGVAEVLRTGGVFIFDANTERLYINRHKGEYARDMGGVQFVQKLKYDAEKRDVTTIFEFADGEVEVHKQRPYDLPELEGLLSAAGFCILQTFSRLNRMPFSVESERLYCVAEKCR